MKSQSSGGGNLSTIDFVFAVVDSPRRPLDFTLILHLKPPPSFEALRAGASSARNLYPTTGSYIEKNNWRRFTRSSADVEAVLAPSTLDVTKAVERFLERPINLHTQMPVQQLALKNDAEGEMKLVSRFHHAAADGVSAAMWLAHQLRVAYGRAAPVRQPAPFQDLAIRNHPSPVKRSRFAFSGPSQRLWSSGNQLSYTRRWHTIRIPATDLRRRCPRVGRFTYNDLLATCALEVFSLWNRGHSNRASQNVALWLPINIRQHSSAGFGNGTSRIRLYASYAKGSSLTDKCREIHRQVLWSKQHGEWAVPSKSFMSRLPLAASGPLLRCYLRRPWIDMATAVFSHVERWPDADNETRRSLKKVECIGQLHARHSLAINGVTHCGQTWLTFTYDPGLLTTDDINSLQELYQDQIARARRELI